MDFWYYVILYADIAGTSVEQCEDRYKENRARDRFAPSYEAEFITADCTKVVASDTLACQGAVLIIVRLKMFSRAQCQVKDTSVRFT